MNPTLSPVGIFMILSLCSFVTLKSIAEEQVAVFAGGCFWCTESDFEKLDGVVSAASGYIGGHIKNPSYKQVSAGGSGHTEAVQVIFDDQKVSYSDLVEYFWKTIDPTDGGGQFCDRGQQYRSEIFYLSEEQQSIAKASKKALANSGLLKSEIATQLTPSSRFYLAEDYHQDYYLKNPVRYNYYRWGCGREKRLEALWGAATK
jgi:peptide-methionine (S)-S-oxide reductase